MKYVTNLYDKEFLTDRVLVRKIWACNMSQQRSSPAANVWNAVGTSIYATEEPHSKSFFLHFGRWYLNSRILSPSPKQNKNTPLPPPKKNQIISSPFFTEQLW